MLFLAFLPFLPLVGDAMIRQLGDNDFQKRESATMFLSKMLRNSDGCRNYSILLAVKKAGFHKNLEIRRRSRQLYEANHAKYYREHPFFYIYLDQTYTKISPHTTRKKVWEVGEKVAIDYKIIQIESGIKQDRNKNHYSDYTRLLCVTPKDFSSGKLDRILETVSKPL